MAPGRSTSRAPSRAPRRTGEAAGTGAVRIDRRESPEPAPTLLASGGSRSASPPRTPCTTSSDSSSCIRVARPRISPSVWGPRRRSSASTTSSWVETSSTSRATCRNFATRLPLIMTSRASPLPRIRSSASSTSSSDSVSTGCRLLFWLQPLTSAFSVIGYWPGVVCAFSTRTPSTRHSAGESSMGRAVYRRFQPSPTACR